MLPFSFKSENRFFINVLDLWEKQGIFQNRVRKKVSDAHSHGLTTFKKAFSHPATKPPDTSRRHDFFL